MPLNTPIMLTWFRVALIPVLTILFYLPQTMLSRQLQNEIGTLIFAFGALTDWLDGYLARRWNQTSSFGAFLDPVADKLLVAAALILLVEFNRAPAWLAVIIIGREITISALREWMAQQGKNKSVAVAYVGKLKTAAQMIAIGFLLWYGPFLFIEGKYIIMTGTIALYLAGILTIVSMFYYLRVAAQQFRQ